MEYKIRTLAKLLFEIPLVGSLLCVIGGLIFGYMAFNLWDNEIHYSLQGRQATAQVEKYEPGKRWTGKVKLAYQADGQMVKAEMITWLSSFKPGDQIPVLYRPDQPELVTMDNLWRRFLPLVLVSLIALFFIFSGARFGIQDMRRLFGSSDQDQAVESGQGDKLSSGGNPT
jgi:hypothetical protein